MTDFPGIVPALAQALDKRGYETLTPVQDAVIAPGLAGRDVLVSAQTGSGKTVAFGLAIAADLLGGEERFAPAGQPLALAVAPTRELALQVQRELEWLYGESGAVVASCVGGMDMRTERRMLERGAHIVVGTPGRLRDHITRHSLDVSGLRAVVLDEADEMLDLGFREDLEFILEASPAERRTLMFSATVPRSIETLAQRYQRDAVRVATIGEKKQHGDIEYRALTVAGSDRENAIINVLRYYEAKNALVFCSTRAAVNHLSARFNNRGFAAVSLSGELSQNERTHALQAMRDGRARVCIATDVAARGIDLPSLELVIHADLPTNPETLLHRSGRTGRAGRKGVSVLIVPSNARRRAERLLQNATITAEWARPPSADEVNARDDERLLADPLLMKPVREDEQEFVNTLIEQHGAERVAAAFIRLHRAGKSAPEELIELASAAFAPMPSGRAEREDPKGKRDEFGPSVWLSISVGRRQSAEPRWLIPMLCRVGKITKTEIGVIKMQPDETYVQIAAHAADNFWAAVGPNREVQNGIRVAALDGAPDLGRQSYGKPAPRKSYDSPRPEYNEGAPKRKFEKKPWTEKPGADARPEKKAWRDKATPTAAEANGDTAPAPKRKFEKKPWTEKPAADARPEKKAWRDKPAASGTDERPQRPALWAKPGGKKKFDKPRVDAAGAGKPIFAKADKSKFKGKKPKV